jgi:uncharacterized membrane protein
MTGVVEFFETLREFDGELPSPLEASQTYLGSDQCLHHLQAPGAVSGRNGTKQRKGTFEIVFRRCVGRRQEGSLPDAEGALPLPRLELGNEVARSVPHRAELVAMVVIVSRLVDRFGARLLLVIIALLLGFACIGMSFVSGPVGLFFGFIGLVIVGVVIVQSFRGGAADKGATANELLANFQEMRSRGDIDDADYRRIKSVLGAELQRELKDDKDKR